MGELFEENKSKIEYQYSESISYFEEKLKKLLLVKERMSKIDGVGNDKRNTIFKRIQRHVGHRVEMVEYDPEEDDENKRVGVLKYNPEKEELYVSTTVADHPIYFDYPKIIIKSIKDTETNQIIFNNPYYCDNYFLMKTRVFGKKVAEEELKNAILDVENRLSELNSEASRFESFIGEASKYCASKTGIDFNKIDAWNKNYDNAIMNCNDSYCRAYQIIRFISENGESPIDELEEKIKEFMKEKFGTPNIYENIAGLLKKTRNVKDALPAEKYLVLALEYVNNGEEIKRQLLNKYDKSIKK